MTPELQQHVDGFGIALLAAESGALAEPPEALPAIVDALVAATELAARGPMAGVLDEIMRFVEPSLPADVGEAWGQLPRVVRRAYLCRAMQEGISNSEGTVSDG